MFFILIYALRKPDFENMFNILKQHQFIQAYSGNGFVYSLQKQQLVISDFLPKHTVLHFDVKRLLLHKKSLGFGCHIFACQLRPAFAQAGMQGFVFNFIYL